MKPLAPGARAVPRQAVPCMAELVLDTVIICGVGLTPAVVVKARAGS